MTDVPGYSTFTKIEPIDKGWSNDKKYRAETSDGHRMLLRVSDIAELDRKKAEYRMMERVYTLGVFTSQPLGFGLCDSGKSVYSLSGWLDGEDVKEVLPLLPETEQYILGMTAGETLRKIHTLPAPDNVEPWSDWFYRKVQGRINFYNTNPIKSESGDLIVQYLQNNKHLLDGRPQTFCHGDFNISNMMITPDKKIGVIDFNAFNKDHGDPWWEFDPCTDGWGSEPSMYFHSGLIKGYFNGDPPNEFFDVFSYYLAYDALAALCDTSVHNQGEPEVGKRHMANILCWFDNMKNTVPTWYLKDFYIQWVDGVPYKLKAPFDFSFLSKYGKVFKVFDDQDSGNICFGTEKDGKRYFVKFAGAPQARYGGTPEDAIVRLKAAIPVCENIGGYPGLIRYISAEEIGGGFATVFEWTDAQGVGRMYPLNHRRFMALPIDKRIKVFEDILAFHEYVCGRGYVAIDFYDGSIMYDFENEKTVICDIDFYQKQPYHGEMGLWGSSRFVSPEECKPGETMDEVTTVYTMGATAFCLFTDSDRSPAAWPLSDAQYAVVKKAVSDERSKRQQSIKQLIDEWRAAK